MMKEKRNGRMLAGLLERIRVGDRYILKAKIVPPREMGDLRIPDDAKVNNQTKKNIHTYC